MFNKIEINEKQRVHDAIANLLMNRSGEWFTTDPDPDSKYGKVTFHTSLVANICDDEVYFIYDKSYFTLNKKDIARLIEVLNKHQSIQNDLISRTVINS